MISYAECSARERLALLLDRLPPRQRVTSPHLAQLDVPSAFDDGIAIGRATLDGRDVFVAAQRARSWAAALARSMAPSWSDC